MAAEGQGLPLSTGKSFPPRDGAEIGTCPETDSISMEKRKGRSGTDLHIYSGGTGSLESRKCMPVAHKT